MTVKQLIDRLRMFPDDREVVAGIEGKPIEDIVEENDVVYIELAGEAS